MCWLAMVRGKIVDFLHRDIRKYTQLFASLLFLVFGFKLLQEVWEHRHPQIAGDSSGAAGAKAGNDPTSPGAAADNEILKEMEEVQRELDEALLNGPAGFVSASMSKRDDDGMKQSSNAAHDMEAGVVVNSSSAIRKKQPNSQSQLNLVSPPAAGGSGSNNAGSSTLSTMLDQWKLRITAALMTVFKPVFVQTFMMTLLAEWGDRSQIATIALAASKVLLSSYSRCLEF